MHYWVRIIGKAQTSFLYGDGTVWGEGVMNDSDYANLVEDDNELWVTSFDFHA